MFYRRLLDRPERPGPVQDLRQQIDARVAVALPVPPIYRSFGDDFIFVARTLDSHVLFAGYFWTYIHHYTYASHIVGVLVTIVMIQYTYVDVVSLVVLSLSFLFCVQFA